METSEALFNLKSVNDVYSSSPVKTPKSQLAAEQP